MTRKKKIVAICLGVLVGVMLGSGYGFCAQKKLTVWGWDFRATKDIAPQVEQFEALHPDVKIETINMSFDDIAKKLMMSLVAGTGAPDVSFEVDDRARKYYGTDLIYTLDDVIPNYEDIFVKALSYRWKYQGKLWGAPYDMGTFVMFYRKDIFDEVGVDFPGSWEELIEVGKKITIPGKRYMTVFTTNEPTQVTSIVQSRGGKVTNIKDEVLFNNPIMAEVCQYVTDAVNKYKVAEYANIFDAAAWVKIKESRWAVIPAWYWYQSFGLKDLAYKPEFDGWWRIARILPWKKGDPPTGAGFRDGGIWLVPKQTKYPELAKKFAASLATKEAQVSQATRRGILPVNALALEELSKWQDPFFGGQKPYKIALAEMRDCPPMEFGAKWWGSMSPPLNNALNAIVFEGMPVKKALEDAEKSARAELAE